MQKQLEQLQQQAIELRKQYFKAYYAGRHKLSNRISEQLAQVLRQIQRFHLYADRHHTDDTHISSPSNTRIMSKYPSACYIVGRFLGAHPAVKVHDDLSMQHFAVDTEENINNIKVFEALRTPNRDMISEIAKFKIGDVVKVNFNVRSVKTAAGKWFTNVTAWSIAPFTPQDTKDFSDAHLDHITPDAPPPATPPADDLPF